MTRASGTLAGRRPLQDMRYAGPMLPKKRRQDDPPGARPDLIPVRLTRRGLTRIMREPFFKEDTMLRLPMACLALLCCAAAAPPPIPQALDPYPLPAKVLADLEKLAAGSDVLILGEVHGMQEVPGVAAALLAPLAKHGYGLLALEIPTDEQRPLTDWATGKTGKVPSFFARPPGDGRGNIQTLALVRTALALRWQVACFDQSGGLALPDKPNPSFDDLVAVSVQRDISMAKNLVRARKGDSKVLAICGGLHARTRNRPLAEKGDDPLRKLWPSFAAALEGDQPTWKVRSVNVVAHSGGFFAMVSEGDEPPVAKVQTIRSRRQLKEAEAHALHDDAWDWELNLPKATPATFLTTSGGALPASRP